MRKSLVVAWQPSGGIRTYFSYVYSHEAFSDFNFVLFTPPMESESTDLLTKTIGSSLKHKQSSSKPTRFILDLKKTIRTEKPEIIHAHGFTAILFTILALGFKSIPIVGTTHDVFLKGVFDGIKGKIKRTALYFAFSRLSVINPVGEDAAHNLVSFFRSQRVVKKVKPIRNGIDTKRFKGDSCTDLKSSYKIPASSILAGFFGRFMAQKGFGSIIDLVEEWNSASERKLHLACFGWGGFIREEQEEIRRRGLQDYFHFEDATDDMGAALRSVDVVLAPSKWEACPLLPMEALVSGVPIIASDCIGMKEVASDTPALVYRSQNQQEFYKTFGSFADNQDEAYNESQSFREEASGRFDVERTSVSLRQLFDQILLD